MARKTMLRADMIKLLKSRGQKGALSKMTKAQLKKLLEDTAPPDDTPERSDRHSSELELEPDEHQRGGHYFDKEGKEIILLGDTNCDLAKKPADQPLGKNAKHISSIYELFSFKQLIEESTRVTLDTATVIDHVATTYARNIVK